jgi:predicted transcriptional regulator
MHIDIELDPSIGERLFAVAEQQGQSASALIAQALQAWLAERSAWPAAVADSCVRLRSRLSASRP